MILFKKIGKYLLLYCFIITTGSTLISQTLLDSFLVELPKTTEHQQRSSLLKKIGDKYYRIHSDSTIKYYHLSLEAAQKSKNHNDDIIILRSLAHLYGNRKNEYIEAKKYLKQALLVAKKRKDDVNLAIVKNDLGVMEKKEGNFQEAIDHFFQAYQLIQYKDSDDARMRILLSLGVIHNETAYNDKAKEYYEEALHLADKNKHQKMKGVILNNLSKICRELGNYKEADQHLHQALDVFNALNNDYWKGLVYYNFGYNFFLQKEYNEAIKYYHLALDLNKKIQEKDREVMILTSLAEVHMTLQNHNEAIDFSLKGMNLLNEFKTTEYYPSLHNILGKSYLKINNYEKSSYHFQQHIVAQQAKDDNGLSSKIGQIQAMYENELKAEAVEKLDLQMRADEIQQQKTTLKFRLLLLSFFSVIAILGLLFYRNKLHQTEKNYQLRNQLSRDLHDNIGSSLNHIKIILGRFTRQINGHQSEIKTIQNLSDGAISNMHDLIWSLDKEKEKMDDLLEYMRDHASNVLSPLGIALSIKVKNEDKNKAVSSAAKNNIYSIYKEAINNIVKHTNPQEVVIRISVKRNTINLHIENDKKELIQEKISSKLGLINMKKRANLINGKLKIRDQKDKFIVDLTVKLIA